MRAAGGAVFGSRTRLGIRPTGLRSGRPTPARPRAKTSARPESKRRPAKFHPQRLCRARCLIMGFPILDFGRHQARPDINPYSIGVVRAVLKWIDEAAESLAASRS